jgi:uncharacterized membrane protein YphA (DoxX/SURF4 family)
MTLAIMSPVVDGFALSCRFVVAFLLLIAAVPKLTDVGHFEQAVSGYGLLPTGAVSWVATWLPRLELLCAVALLVGIFVLPVALVAAALLTVFAFGVGVNLLRGRDIDCGCRGGIAPRKIGWGLVAGDLVLAGMSAVAGVINPSVLVIDGGLSGSHVSALGSSDGVAIISLAISVVLGQLLISGAFRVRSRVRGSQALIREGM